jgi:hypothetical protein
MKTIIKLLLLVAPFIANSSEDKKFFNMECKEPKNVYEILITPQVSWDKVTIQLVKNFPNGKRLGTIPFEGSVDLTDPKRVKYEATPEGDNFILSVEKKSYGTTGIDSQGGATTADGKNVQWFNICLQDCDPSTVHRADYSGTGLESGLNFICEAKL